MSESLPPTTSVSHEFHEWISRDNIEYFLGQLDHIAFQRNWINVEPSSAVHFHNVWPTKFFSKIKEAVLFLFRNFHQYNQEIIELLGVTYDELLALIQSEWFIDSEFSELIKQKGNCTASTVNLIKDFVNRTIYDSAWRSHLLKVFFETNYRIIQAGLVLFLVDLMKLNPQLNFSKVFPVRWTPLPCWEVLQPEIDIESLRFHQWCFDDLPEGTLTTTYDE